jgi:4'-phosphopantetheinyl transferase
VENYPPPAIRAAKAAHLLNKLLNVYGVDVWSGELDAGEELLSYFASLLSAAERYKADRFATTALRNRYIEVRGRVRCLLAQYCNGTPPALRFSAGSYGKPCLPDYPGVAFNLSHSRQLVAAAVGYRCRIGIDVEVWRERINDAGIVRRCFAHSEQAYWENLPLGQQREAFYALWTQKEAFVKAAGRGIGLGLERCVIATQGPARLISVPEEFGSAGDWRVAVLNVGGAASGALVVGP